MGKEAGRNAISRRTMGWLLAIAILFAIIIIPTPSFSVYRTLTSGTSSLQYSSSIFLPSASFTQQTTQLSSNSGYSAGWIPTSSALGLAYQFARSGTVQANPFVATASQTISPGDNITFVIKASPNVKLSQLSNFALYIFVVGPNGLVGATYPVGAQLQTISSTNGQPYFGITGYSAFNFRTLSTNDLAQNGVEFTWQTPKDNASSGTWVVYAFASGSEASNGQTTTIMGASDVSYPVVSESGTNWVIVGFGFLGSILTIFQVETISLTGARQVGKTHRRWLADNALLLMGIAFIVFYIYSVYHVI